MGLHSINNQCFRNIFASLTLIFQNHFVSITLLLPLTIHHNYGDNPKCAMYYDSTVECHTPEYSVFAAIAGFVLITFIIFPTVLLVLYPTRLFQKCVSYCKFRRWHALHMFVDSFQGQYKDGTNGTWDFRMISASFLILRILIVALFSNHSSYVWGSLGQTVLLAIFTCFYAITMKFNEVK